jgi:hypothetical protein
VAEVAAQNEYQLKLRDLALNERVRQLTDKAAAEAAEAAARCATPRCARMLAPAVKPSSRLSSCAYSLFQFHPPQSQPCPSPGL